MFSFMIFAGIPAAMQLSGMSRTTTAFAPIMELHPIWTGPKILAPLLMKTLSPMTGTCGWRDFPPIVTFGPMLHSRPIMAFLCMTTPIPP